MLKKRFYAHRKNRLHEGDPGLAGGKKDGPADTGDNTAGSSLLFKYKRLRICEDIVRRFRRKSRNEHSSGIDGSFLDLEFKNHELEALNSELADINLQLCLYLNAGMVLSKALDRLAEDRRGLDTPGSKLLVRTKEVAILKNLPFESVLFDNARIIRSRALLRFAVLLADNKGKGAQLCEKLDTDRMQMLNTRLSDAKAKAKKAETKLCFPLTVLLIALVVVCIAPALMNM